MWLNGSKWSSQVNTANGIKFKSFQITSPLKCVKCDYPFYLHKHLQLHHIFWTSVLCIVCLNVQILSARALFYLSSIASSKTFLRETLVKDDYINYFDAFLTRLMDKSIKFCTNTFGNRILLYSTHLLVYQWKRKIECYSSVSNGNGFRIADNFNLNIAPNSSLDAFSMTCAAFDSILIYLDLHKDIVNKMILSRIQGKNSSFFTNFVQKILAWLLSNYLE
ncbi:hypothetical protein EGR_09543 [Echinococcus granulosus]|uniref:Uncharacterized protein n=1 Tax=Echinococcus granulosus TaxID=6210 RepID=W6U3A1_ECHGR|nr:hypothetical protein EGR_09543 [Echinococcus granulosus]EUB55603.1 hypothetical protein EGR_09543 [Echinococcus granulosus]